MSNFRIQNVIKALVEKESESAGVEKHTAFIRIFLRETFDLDDQEIEDAITDGRMDKGIDAIFEYSEDDENRLCLLQSKYCENPDKSIDEDTKNKLINALQNYILNECTLVNVHEKLRSKITTIKEKFSRGEIDKIYLVIVTNGQDAQRHIYEEMETYLKTQKQIEFKVFDEEDFKNLLLPASARGVKKAALKIIKDPGVGSQTRLIFPQADAGSIDGFICKVDISEVAKMVEDNREIFSANVRTFQSLKNKVNSEIEKTITDPDLIGKFCYLNNGITIVCEDFDVSPDGSSVSFASPSIVNGCQTASTIHQIFKRSGIEENLGHVMVKVIKSKDENFRKKIIIASNAQTAIKERDLRSEDDIQKQLEKEFLSLGFFYERKSKMHSGLGADAEKVVPMEKAAQAYRSFFLGEPAEAKNKKGEIFKSAYDRIFDKDITAEKLLFSFKLLKEIEEVVARKKKAEKREKEKSIYGNATLHILALYKIWILEAENWNENNLTINALGNVQEKIEKVIEKMMGLLPSVENAQYFFKSSESLAEILEKAVSSEGKTASVMKTEIIITNENVRRKKDWRYFKPDEFSVNDSDASPVTHWSELFKILVERFGEKMGGINHQTLEFLERDLISRDEEKNNVKLHPLANGYFLNTNFEAKVLARMCFDLVKKNGEKLRVKLRPTSARINKNYKR